MTFSTDRLRSRFWIQAWLRRCDLAGLSAVVRRAGDPDSGAIVVKLDTLSSGCQIFTAVRGLDGRLTWVGAFKEGLVPHATAESYLDRALARDPDMWVVEIENKAKDALLEGL